MIDRLTRNQLVRLSTDERLSPEFREACRVELGDREPVATRVAVAHQ